MAFLRSRPFGLGCASIRAAYSASDAFYPEGLARGKGKALGHYLDVDKMFEEFGLTMEIRITFDSIGNLQSKVVRAKYNRV